MIQLWFIPYPIAYHLQKKMRYRWTKSDEKWRQGTQSNTITNKKKTPCIDEAECIPLFLQLIMLRDPWGYMRGNKVLNISLSIGLNAIILEQYDCRISNMILSGHFRFRCNRNYHCVMLCVCVCFVPIHRESWCLQQKDALLFTKFYWILILLIADTYKRYILASYQRLKLYCWWAWNNEADGEWERALRGIRWRCF